MKALSLNGADWRLDGFWINQWRIGASSPLSRPMVPSIPATVPGAVHADLKAAGWIPDWQAGSNSFDSEWVNNRDWRFSRTVHAPEDFKGKLALEFDGLDYAGSVSIDGREIGSFEGTHLRHRFELPDVKSGQTFELSVMFAPAPALDGQIGWTSKTRIFKPRFGYWWDWCSRIINVGIWQDVRLVSRGPIRLEHIRVLPRMDDDLKTGRVTMVGKTAGGACRAKYELKDRGGAVVARGEKAIEFDDLKIDFPVKDVQLWWPTTHGDQPLYALKVELLDPAGNVSDQIERTIGFKHVRWLQNPGASSDARPYWCEINGVPLFLRGVNWIPPSPLYGTIRPADYEAFIRQYRHMHANILRVWGGAILEKPAFYEWCDKLGLLVWQEFPLSSSGLDSLPPSDPAIIAELKRIATEFVERRGHHASHLLWCGGNELQKKAVIDGQEEDVPIDESEPLMQEWIKLIDELDPGKRFLTTSSTGPRFYAFAKDFGKGLHHDVHGPWANTPLSERYAYWNGDDSLFRSEVGAPGCASMPMLERYCDTHLSRGRGLEPGKPIAGKSERPAGSWREILWPPRIDNPAWLVPASTWVPGADVAREFGELKDDPSQLDIVVKASRYLQAESYRYVAETARRNYPHTSGFMIWCGHDMLHCTCNNSVIEVNGSAKPAFDWLRLAYAPRNVSLRSSSISYPAGSRFDGQIWLCADPFPPHGSNKEPKKGQLDAFLIDLEGHVLQAVHREVSFLRPSAEVASIAWQIPELPQKLFVVSLHWKSDEGEIVNRYLFSQQREAPLAPLLNLRQTALVVEPAAAGKVRVRNGNHVAAIGVRLTRPGHLIASPNHFILLPGETESIEYQIPAAAVTDTSLQIECFNGPTIPVTG